ncbi:right-handed parallel beta-helix repeat-containing protein [Taibaiella chishuiensis]|uniref:Pectate lyase-like protein n=1 Tax=Taibaiella chishuiensis TaxID=1434707 RepID=A0A2P8DB66_9BACT|nr:right-handed parallel beta-helix repeat-containing protein [Taibaiella chishuiensis]PSK94462.1 pectate lyase-like protein [Taibaiella chishuiensis]
MKRRLYHLLMLLLLAACAGQAQGQKNVLVYSAANRTHTDKSRILTLDLKKDFGAIGNGAADDQPAFDAAAAFINARKGNCKLVIPQGTYRVGRQVANKEGRYMTGSNVMNIGGEDVGYQSNIEIAGAGQAILKYKDNMQYGYFTMAGMPQNIQAAKGVDVHKEAATLGKCINIFNCGNVRISNLVLDGNFYPGKMKVGGRHLAASQGIQQEHYGIFINYSENVSISNVTAKRFGLDGFLIFNASTVKKNIRFDNCVADYNGRQGMSILFADGVQVNNCKFTNTGMGELQYSGLQAGVDLEPEQSDYVIQNVTFNNCTFENSRNTSVAVSSGAGKVRNISFTKCNIINVNTVGNSIALDIGRHKALQFTDCNIYGYVLIAQSNAATASEGYSFKRCLFSDCYYGKSRQSLVPTSTILIYPPGGNQNWDYVTMDNCTFDVYTKRPWHYLKSAPGRMSRISNSIIYANGGKEITGNDNTILQDDNISLENNTFYLRSESAYIHGGKTIAPANSTAEVKWNGNTIRRWGGRTPARQCTAGTSRPR